MELSESRRMIISSSPHKKSVTESVATLKTDTANEPEPEEPVEAGE